MPRPRKWRRVCCLPERNRFGPLESGLYDQNTTYMTVDQYETIRLIDLEGLTQEECAAQMSVSRTTVQGIYDEARKILAGSLVNGDILVIGGGDYQLCGGDGPRCEMGACHRHGCRRAFEPGFWSEGAPKEKEGDIT